MKNTLASKQHLIVDRYSYSGAAYFAAKGGDRKFCDRLEDRLIVPDVVFFLDIYPEEAAKRGGFGNETTERIDLQRRVYYEFARLRLAGSTHWVVLDGTLTKRELHRKVMKEMRRMAMMWPYDPVKHFYHFPE